VSRQELLHDAHGCTGPLRHEAGAALLARGDRVDDAQERTARHRVQRGRSLLVRGRSQGVSMGRIYLSPPHIGPMEQELVSDAFASNWIAPLGPHVDAFEQEFANVVGTPHAAAVSSGTAALHLALRLIGVASGDTVFVSSFTFVASVSPILFCGAAPVFIDS